MVFSSTDMFRERELERGDDLIGFMSHFATFFLVHFECEKTNRERERDDDVVADDDFNDDSDDDENDRGSSKSTSFLLHAQSKRGGFLLLLLLEIVVENKDDDFLIVQKFRRGRAKALQKKDFFCPREHKKKNCSQLNSFSFQAGGTRDRTKEKKETLH